MSAAIWRGSGRWSHGLDLKRYGAPLEVHAAVDPSGFYRRVARHRESAVVLVVFQNDASTLRSGHLRNFLNYLQQQIDEGAINRPWSRIHVVDAGLFIVVPDILRDYDLNAVRDLQFELASASFIVKTDNEASSWIYCAPEAKSLRGHVLDPVKCGLQLGKFRINHILTCPPQLAGLPVSR